jgi:transcriptional regulator with XRE-family HTH domain
MLIISIVSPRIARVNPMTPQLASFGQEVRRRRLALKLTLEDLAQASGLTPNYIGSIELGKRDPSLSSIDALAKALRVPIGQLIGGSRELTPAGMEAASLFDESAPEVQAAISSILRAMARKRK